jgi:hypothetical protein
VQYIKNYKAFKHSKEPNAQRAQIFNLPTYTSMQSLEDNFTEHKNSHTVCYDGRGVGQMAATLLAVLSTQ